MGVYYVLVGSGSMLVALGLFMVLSASSVMQYQVTGSSYTMFNKQLVFGLVGLVGAFIAAQLSVRVWKWLAVPGFVVAMFLQGLVFTSLGVEVLGNRNWIELGGQRLQPSEFGKIALVLLAGLILTHKRRVLGSSWQAVIPFVPASMLLVGLVMLGNDLGTSLVLLAIVAGSLFAAGARLRLFVVSSVLAAAGAIALVVQKPYRLQRIQAWLGDSCTDPHVEGCYQKVHGQYALADGGWWGVGPGASREKWAWLPEAHNDFIFAIIGEELGLLGALVVITLFAALGFACYRLVVQTREFFARVVSAAIMVWLLGQAIINIGSVIGMLPIVGVPLPLVSSGGTALISSMIAVGILVSFARAHPDVRRSSAQHRSRLGRGQRREKA